MKKAFVFSAILASCVALTTVAGNPDDNNPIKKALPLIPEGGGDGNKFSIGIAAGTTIPLQDYSNTGKGSDSTHITGSAQTGIHFNATIGYNVYKIIGAMVMVGGNINSYNGATSSLGTAITPSGSHYVGQYLAGPYISIPIGKKFFIEARALVGLMTSHYPELSSSYSASFGSFASTNISYDLKYKPGTAFGYSGVVGAKYMLGNHFGITLHAAYSGSNMKYPSNTIHFVETTSSIFQVLSPTTNLNTNTTTTSTTLVHMSIGMINISAGAVFSF